MTTLTSELAGTLERRIVAGEFRVGHLLPTEAELCEEFGVSRFTVREALRRLQSAGLVTRRQGSGTRVTNRYPDVRHSASISNGADILRYAGETHLKPIDGWKAASRADRRALTLSGAWLVCRALRLTTDQAAVGVTTIAVRAELEATLASIDLAQPRAIFAQLVDLANLRLTRIDQEIFATTLDGVTARRLGELPGSPSLAITRHYEAEELGCFQVARTLHPSTRFRYRLELAPP